MSSGNPASGGGFGFSGGAGSSAAGGGLGQSNTSLFGASTPKPAFGGALTGTSGAGGLFSNSAQQTGILGSMLQTPAASNTSLGLFGQQTPQNQLTFGGKRGKPAF